MENSTLIQGTQHNLLHLLNTAPVSNLFGVIELPPIPYCSKHKSRFPVVTFPAQHYPIISLCPDNFTSSLTRTQYHRAVFLLRETCLSARALESSTQESSGALRIVLSCHGLWVNQRDEKPFCRFPIFTARHLDSVSWFPSSIEG